MAEPKYRFDPSKSKLGYGAIDIVVNMYTPEIMAAESFRRMTVSDQVRMESDHRTGLRHEEYIGKMDRAGIERSLLIAVRCGDRRMSTSSEIPYERVYEASRKYPDRYSGLAGIDPMRGVAGLKELDKAVRVRLCRRAPLSALVRTGAGCGDLLSVLFALRRTWHSDHDAGRSLPCLSKDDRLATVARPITLDRVAIDFPELTIIGIHLGYPWMEEMIAVCQKHPNVYMAGDAYAPKHWGADGRSLRQHLRSG